MKRKMRKRQANAEHSVKRRKLSQTQKKPKSPKRVPVSILLVVIALTALGSISVGFLAKPAQTVYFTQSLTTLSTWTLTWAQGTDTFRRICGNVPDNATVITAHCSDEPIPEFPVAPLVAFVLLAASVLLLRRRRR